MELNVRFVERPLGERSFADQTRAVQNAASLRKVTISVTGIAMMSAIVGKRMSTVLKRNIALALQETIDGHLESGGGGEGDLLAQVYGEILGPLFTCLERDGDFTIIRLSPPKRDSEPRKRADFLLVDQNSGSVMLQEAKGHCPDWEAVAEEPDSLDICQNLRAMRNKGKAQLNWPSPDMLGANRVRVRGRPRPSIALVPCGEQSVVATVVPDGRLRSAGFRIEPPPHDQCNNPCISCLHSPEANLITILSSERLDEGQPLTPDARVFLDWYRACERATWGRAHGSFGNAFASLLGSWHRLEMPSDLRASNIPLMISLVEDAIQQGVYVEFRPIWQSFEESRPSEGLAAALRRLHDIQGDITRPDIREGSTEELGRLLFGREREGNSKESISGNWLVMARSKATKSAGTHSEVHVAPARGGLFEVMIVPRGVSDPDATLDLCWGLAEVISGGSLPAEYVYESFREEVVQWWMKEGNETKSYRLGKSLSDMRCPMWPWAIDRRCLQKMHNCCPACGRIADCIEDWGRFHRLLHWRHHHCRVCGSLQWGNPLAPLAFVTTDGRAVLRVLQVGD